MNDTIRKKAELALLYSVPVLSDANENSRLSGLQRRLQEAVIPCLQRLPHFTDKDLEEVINKVLTWGKDTGWLDDKKRISALISFCVDMVERSAFVYPDKITGILTDIADHLERGKNLSTLDCSEGAAASEKWEEMFNKEL